MTCVSFGERRATSVGAPSGSAGRVLFLNSEFADCVCALVQDEGGARRSRTQRVEVTRWSVISAASGVPAKVPLMNNRVQEVPEEHAC